MREGLLPGPASVRKLKINIIISYKQNLNMKIKIQVFYIQPNFSQMVRTDAHPISLSLSTLTRDTASGQEGSVEDKDRGIIGR